jgi:hypothetical protein
MKSLTILGSLGYQDPSHFRNPINHETFPNELAKSIYWDLMRIGIDC